MCDLSKGRCVTAMMGWLCDHKWQQFIMCICGASNVRQFWLKQVPCMHAQYKVDNSADEHRLTRMFSPQVLGAYSRSRYMCLILHLSRYQYGSIAICYPCVIIFTLWPLHPPCSPLGRFQRCKGHMWPAIKQKDE